MANYTFTSNTNSVLVDVSGKQSAFGNNELRPYTPDRAGNIVYLYDLTGILKKVGTPSTHQENNRSKDRVPLIIGTDTIDVGGTTVWANAGALLDALRAIFFLASANVPIIPESQRVNTFADLPDPVSSDGQYWIVDQATGTWILGTRRDSGIYKSVASSWVRRGADVPYYLEDDQFTIKDSGDATKQLGFEVTGVSSGQRRILTPLDKNYTIGEDRVTVKLIQDINDLLRLHTPNGANEIELTFPIYEIDSPNLDLGVYTLVANQGVTLKGISQEANQISSSGDNADLITVNNGNLFIQNLILETTGVNSQNIVMGGSGSESLDMFYVQLNGTFGTLSDIRQGFWTNGFSFGASQGFTLDGTIGGFTLVDTRIINCGDFILGAGASLSINNIRSNVNATIALGDFAFNFDYGNFAVDGGYQIQSGRFDGDGDMLAPFTDVGRDTDEAEKSTRSFMRDNSGGKAKNTRPGIAYDIDSEVLTPLTLNVPARMESVGLVTKEEHFRLITDNIITFKNTISGDFTLFFSLLVDGGANDIIRIDIRKYDDLATPTNFTVIGSLRRSIPNSQGGLDVGSFVIPIPDVNINFEERIEIWCTNESDNTDATLKIGSTVFVRPS